jgi:hypothetical protein
VAIPIRLILYIIQIQFFKSIFDPEFIEVTHVELTFMEGRL